MSGGSGGAAELEKLAAELDSKTYAVTLLTVAGRRPCLSVTNRTAVQVTEFIYAAPDGDGVWWFGGDGRGGSLLLTTCPPPRRR